MELFIILNVILLINCILDQLFNLYIKEFKDIKYIVINTIVHLNKLFKIMITYMALLMIYSLKIDNN